MKKTYTVIYFDVNEALGTHYPLAVWWVKSGKDEFRGEYQATDLGFISFWVKDKKLTITIRPATEKEKGELKSYFKKLYS